FPPFPAHYLPTQQQAILLEWRDRVLHASAHGQPLPEFPEHLIAPVLDNTWHDTAEAVLGNWMGCMYQVTHQDRRKPFMDNVNPDNPLNLDIV
ncbi:MAG: homoserine O-succinyltransferase, partial [Sulfuricella sp.]|nr:homoserine O-succinyltransferase [Sulfuricella sp.]